MPLLEMLGGDRAVWDVRPDSEHDAVHARRERIAAILGAIARVPAGAAAPSPHPALTFAAMKQDRATAEVLWEALGEDWRARAQIIGELRAPVAGQFAAIETVLTEIQDTDFGGESPLGENISAMFDMVRTGMAAFQEQWASLGETFCPAILGETWPAPASLPEAEQAKWLAYTRRELRNMEDNSFAQ